MQKPSKFITNTLNVFKMKMLLKISALFLALGVLTFVACKKENTEPTKASEIAAYPLLDKVAVSDGRLKFESIQSFENSIKSIHEKQNSLKGFESQFSDFVSSSQVFEAITEEDFAKQNGDISKFKNFAVIVEKDGEKYFEPVIDLVHLSYLINQEGLLQVGDDVYKFTRDNLYKFSEAQMKDYIQFKDRIDLMPNVIKTPITRKIETSERWDVAQCDAGVPNSSGNRKVSTEIENTSTWLYSEAKIRVINRRKVLGIWVRSFTNGIDLSGSIFTKVLQGVNIVTNNAALADSSTWERELHEVANWTVLGIVLQIGGSASGSADPQGDSNGSSSFGCTVTK